MKEFCKDKHKIAIIGMGYVGLPLSLLLARNYSVIGFDVDASRIEKMQEWVPTISEPGVSELMNDTEVKKNISYSSNSDDLKDAKVKIVTVGTPYESPISSGT